MVTIRKIAEASGVSRGTVDKVLNNRYGVSDEVREKVHKVAEELGYRPNLAGKALAYQKKRIKIGMIILDKHNHVFQEVHRGAEHAYQELKDFGLSVDFCIMDSDSVEEQSQYIDILSRKGISALAITPLDDPDIKERLIRLDQQGIKIVIINTDIKGIERLCFIGQDLKRSGRVAGQLIGELLPEGGEVAIISGEDKYEALYERIEGFIEILSSEYSDIKIVDIVRNIRNSAEAYVRTVELFERHGNLKAVYITTAKNIESIGKAIKEMKKGNLKYVSNDSVPEVVQLIKERIVDFTITQEPYAQGAVPLRILFSYFFQDEIPASEYHYTKLEIVTKENISDIRK